MQTAKLTAASQTALQLLTQYAISSVMVIMAALIVKIHATASQLVTFHVITQLTHLIAAQQLPNAEAGFSVQVVHVQAALQLATLPALV